ncbi:transposase domain-containing protein [Kitasatospora sp. NBC_00458]|uniref:transposase domain-containing protein n=1 Tax=Kitasatospora sp. NBC_00458 TaxID=2903568 RepID=UPI002E18D587
MGRYETAAAPHAELAERIAIGLLTWSFPPALVDEVLVLTGRTEQRTRLLPARVVVYFVLALCLFPGLKYERVAELLSQGMRWGFGLPGSCPVPTAAALSRARARLGPEPLRALFAARAAQVPPAPGLLGLRVLSLDTARFEVPDSEENAAGFTRPGTPGGPPRVRVVALACDANRVVVDARIGVGGEPAVVAARPLLREAGRGDLLLAALGMVGARSWCTARANGAELLWGVPVEADFVRHATLPDGSYRSVLDGAGDCDEDGSALAVPVRVVEHTVDGRRLRLVTSLLDPVAAPADALAALFLHRWRFREALAELAAGRPDGAVPALRARSRRGVEQEVWGYLLVHQALAELLRPARDRGEPALDGAVATAAARRAAARMAAAAAVAVAGAPVAGGVPRGLGTRSLGTPVRRPAADERARRRAG